MAKLKLDWIDVVTLRRTRKKKGQAKKTVVIMRHPDLNKEKFIVQVRYDDPNMKGWSESSIQSFNHAMLYAVNVVTDGGMVLDNKVKIKYV